MKYNLPVILLRGTVLIPQNELKLEFEDELSKNLIDEAELFHDNKILIVTQNTLEENIIIKDLPRIGTIAEITRKLELPNGKVRIALKGKTRAGVIEYLNPTRDIIESIVQVIPKEKISDEVKTGILKKINTELGIYIERVPYMSNSLLSLISDTDDLNVITDIIVNHMPLENKRLFEYLVEPRCIKRAEMILEDIYKQEKLFNIEKNIDTKVKKELDKDQKNFYIKEKIKQLQDELGEASPKEEEVKRLRQLVENLSVKDSIKEKLNHEINRYESMSSMSPEISIVRNYIEVVLNLPWNINTEDIDDLSVIKENLDKSEL